MPTWASSLEISIASSGRPVVVSRAGALPEVCGDAALYFDPQHVADLAARLLEIARDSALAAELGPHKVRVNMVVPTWMWGPPVEGYIQWQAHERKIPGEQVKAELESLFSISQPEGARGGEGAAGGGCGCN